ncbi:MAG: hypothetical protein KDD03_12055 [Gelidibacter sp.]|nr:hypothetical protein [Gelidibacter sp.]
MISSFFSKTKPIHLVVVSILLLVVFVVAKIFTIHEPLSLELFGKQSAFFIIVWLSLFTLDFFVSKNNLTKKNSYKILMFALFIAVLPESILNSRLLLSNFFVLLALRRIISLRSQKEIKKKLFDAAFWVSIASLLHFWASLFFLLIFAAMILYSIRSIKNWIVPFVGVLTVAIITTSLMMVFNIDYQNYASELIGYSFDFTQLNSVRIIMATTILISYGTWASFFFIKHIKNKSKSYRPSFVLIIITSILALMIIVVSQNKTGSEFIFLFAPLSIIMTNYLEVTEEKWFKEILIWVLILIPLVSLML